MKLCNEPKLPHHGRWIYGWGFLVSIWVSEEGLFDRGERRLSCCSYFMHQKRRTILIQYPRSL